MSNFSEERYERFSAKLADVLNYGALNLALGIGYRLGLFKTLAQIEEPRTAEIIAARAGLNARYVREWLGVMMAGGVVELSTGSDGEPLFFLPPEHAAPLIGTADRANMGVYTQEIPLLTSLAQEAVIEGFRTGQGVPYTNYPRFQAFMTELSDAKLENLLVQRFLPSVDEGRLIEGLDRGIRVLDLGCGEGAAVLLMAKAFPHSQIVGLELCEDVVAVGRRSAEALGLENASFIVKDAADLENDPAMAEAFDYVLAFDAIHDQTAPDKALRGVHHLLVPGGLFSMVDIAAESDPRGNRDHSMGPFLYAVSLMHCLPVGLCEDGMGLGMMWGRQRAVEMLKEAGFQQVEVLEMEYDTFNYHFLCRKDKNP